MVVVEGTLDDALQQARGIHENAIIGTLAAWQRRYAPFCFAGGVETAARMAEAFLRGQVREIQRSARALSPRDLRGALSARPRLTAHRSTRKITLDQAPIITLVGKAFWETSVPRLRVELS
jgi:hypothetical protein